MERFFNTQGPCVPSRHYMLPPLDRLPTIRRHIDRGKYLVLHAPRQVGKTTALLTLAQALTQEGQYLSAVLSMETGAPFPADVQEAERRILEQWRGELGWQLPPGLRLAVPEEGSVGDALRALCAASPRRLVLFLDEIDALKGQTLLAVLRQLRAGYPSRPGAFPWSLVLCGMRDVRDYRYDPDEPDCAHSASPFNMKESLTLRAFTGGEVAALYRQHTEASGQPFTEEAVERCFTLSAGHPWLVNALGAELVDEQVPDRACAITVAHVERAREAIIQRRETHLDSLVERLREPRVRRIIEPILVGAPPRADVLNDDLVYARDLGLLAPDAPVRIANPLYQEVIPRALAFQAQEYLDERAGKYLREDGSLDMVLLLASFQEFFAENSEAWLQRFDYQEAGPHLLLMAYLQRVVNGGGRISREFAVGSGRADLVVDYGGRRAVLELKLWRGPQTEAQGLAQLGAYLERLGEPEGHLVLFDRRPGRGWADKVYLKETAGPQMERIFVYGA